MTDLKLKLLRSGKRWARRDSSSGIAVEVVVIKRVSKTAVFWHPCGGGPEERLNRASFLAGFYPVEQA